ncbi:MAG TPA: hypothetical protein VES20_10080, partial [Bryobacteraceae bacterium]|nr:hypothetical protein [Bryobacteraceae bacterium]
MERSATISLSEGTLQQEQVLPSQAVFGAVLDRVLANHPLEDVLKTSATLMELHLGLSDCSVRVPGSASPAEAARKVRDLRSADGALLATVSASSDVKDEQAENQLDQVCRILAHALEHEKLRAEV